MPSCTGKATDIIEPLLAWLETLEPLEEDFPPIVELNLDPIGCVTR